MILLILTYILFLFLDLHMLEQALFSPDMSIVGNTFLIGVSLDQRFDPPSSCLFLFSLADRSTLYRNSYYGIGIPGTSRTCISLLRIKIWIDSNWIFNGFLLELISLKKVWRPLCCCWRKKNC